MVLCMDCAVLRVRTGVQFVVCGMVYVRVCRCRCFAAADRSLPPAVEEDAVPALAAAAIAATALRGRSPLSLLQKRCRCAASVTIARGRRRAGLLLFGGSARLFAGESFDLEWTQLLVWPLVSLRGHLRVRCQAGPGLSLPSRKQSSALPALTGAVARH